jgi:uncharacterized protein
MLLTVTLLVLDVLKPLDPAGPSFDCSKATAVVPLLICSDNTLIALDRDMAGRYTAWRSAHPADADAAKRQASWLTQRDACASAAALQSCVSTAYQQRITELKIIAGQVPVFARATYRCAGQAGALSASYYHSEPAAVLVEFDGARVVAFTAPAASGARYAGDEVELWEHQGTAALKWRGQQLQCPRSADDTTTPGGQHP